MRSEINLFTGSSNIQLAKSISEQLGLSLSDANVGSFSDGETRVELKKNVRGSDVFIIQSTCSPANHHIMEALVIADACRRASAQNINLVVPYFGYARQERKSASRTPITAKLVASLFEAAGIHRVITLELHNSALQGFFDIPVDHLFAKRIFYKELSSLAGNDLLVVSPDAGGVERARAMAKLLRCGLAIVDKRRDRPNTSAVMNIIGDVSQKVCLIVDDIVDTGGSLVNAAEALKKSGAKEVSAAITHPVLSGQAVEKIEKSVLSKLYVTNSIPLDTSAQKSQKICQINIAELIAESIRRVHNRESVSSLFS